MKKPSPITPGNRNPPTCPKKSPNDANAAKAGEPSDKPASTSRAKTANLKETEQKFLYNLFMSTSPNYPLQRPYSQAVVFTLCALSIACAFVFGLGVFAKTTCDDVDTCAQQIQKYETEYESVSKQLTDIRAKKDDILGKIAGYSSQISVTQTEIDSLQNDITDMQEKLELLNQTLVEKKDALGEKIAFRNKVVRDYYQHGVLNSFELLLTTYNELSGFQVSAFSYVFAKSLTSEALRIIAILNTEIKSYEADKQEAEELKTELETTQINLVALKNQLANQKTSAEVTRKDLVEKESDVAEELQSLQEKIDKLTSLQQQLLATKAGDSYVSGYEPPSYKLPEPQFSPAFALMSYGAYTHYNGMSQYGAKGRAQAGQDYKEIVKFYYKEGVSEKDDFPGEIRVSGYDKMDFQEYLYGLAEMPSSWPADALKAQAVAARSYAYRYVKAGKEICTTQSCQVFSKSKSDNPPESWRKAVYDTKDEIIGGDTGAAGYGWDSSTAGGYINNVGWDPDGSWPGGAYEKKAGSPWFYKAWYTQSYTDGSGTCGRSTPWLDEDEMADILNAWVVWKKGSGSDRNRISPVTTGCWGGDPYSHGKMKDRADELGTAYSGVSGASVDISNSGKTAKITFSTNNGSVSIDGDEFKTVFNLRAPGYVSIRNRLFGVEARN